MSAARLFIAYSFQSTARVAKQLCTSDRKLILAVRRRYCVAAARDSPARPARKLENLPILRRRDKFLRRLFIGVINFAGNYLIGALLNCVVRRLSKERVQSRNCNCSGSNKVLARLAFFFSSSNVSVENEWIHRHDYFAICAYKRNNFQLWVV